MVSKVILSTVEMSRPITVVSTPSPVPTIYSEPKKKKIDAPPKKRRKRS